MHLVIDKGQARLYNTYYQLHSSLVRERFMRKLLPLLCLVVFLAVAMPAQAQLRQNLPVQRASSKLFDSEAVSFVMNKIFSPQHFRMQHSYEMSFGSFGGHSSSLGMYTNTMMWQFDQKLAARVDIAFAHSP